jgi:hypothetical protein
MLMLFDNDTLLGLAIRNQVDGISRAIDSIDAVPRLSAGGAHTPAHLLTTSSTASAYASNGIGRTEVTRHPRQDRSPLR